MSNLLYLGLVLFFAAANHAHVVFWKIELDYIKFLFLLLFQIFHVLLSDAFDLQKLGLELNFFLKFHLDYKPLIIIDH